MITSAPIGPAGPAWPRATAKSWSISRQVRPEPALAGYHGNEQRVHSSLQAEPSMTGELLSDHVNEWSAAINRLIATSDAEIAKIVGAENVKLN